MSYKKPEEATAPSIENEKNLEGWEVPLTVIFDGGAKDKSSLGFSIAYGKYVYDRNEEAMPCLALRWNGNDNVSADGKMRELGMPFSFGHATWFVLPDLNGLYKVIIESDLIPAHKRQTAYKFLYPTSQESTIKPINKWITTSQKKYLARFFMSFGVISIITLATALYGRLELNVFEYISLSVAAIGTSVFGFLLEKD